MIARQIELMQEIIACQNQVMPTEFEPPDRVLLEELESNGYVITVIKVTESGKTVLCQQK